MKTQKLISRITLIGLFLYSMNGSSQVVSWLKGTDGVNNQDSCTANATNPLNGEITVVGYTTNTISPVADLGGGAYFQPNFGGGARDGYIIRYSKEGNVLWATLFGGSGHEHIKDVVIDNNGNTYIVGASLFSPNFPLKNLSGAYNQVATSNDFEAFIAKFDPSGVLLWNTFLSGSYNNIATSISIDSSNNVYVAGITKSSDFPLYNPGGGAYYQGVAGGGNLDCFISKFNENGAMLWCTYYGGSGDDYLNDIAVSNKGDISITGYTNSQNFPLQASGSAYFNNSLSGSNDAFIVSFNASMARTWGTYLGGSGNDEGYALSTDSSGFLLVAGSTFSADFPFLGYVSSYKQNYGGNGDAFIAHFREPGETLITSYGGSDYDAAKAIISDYKGNFYVGGHTRSNDLPVANGGYGTYYKGTLDGTADGFLLQFNDSLERVWGTYVGDSDFDVIEDLSLLKNGAKAKILTVSGNFTNQLRLDGLSLFPGGTGVKTFTASFGNNVLPLNPVIHLQNGDTICNSEDVCFNVTASQKIDSMFIDWNDGNAHKVYTDSACHTYFTQGAYTIVVLTYFGNLIDTTYTNIVVASPVADFFVADLCQGDSLVFIDKSESMPGYENVDWTWKFNFTGYSFSANNGTPYCVGPIAYQLGVDTATLVVINSLGCVDSITKTYTIVNCDSVWPGDANVDLTANIYDLLPLGMAFNATGTPRASTSNLWQPYESAEWNKDFVTWLNYKHADCNGDGIINFADTTAILLNYGKAHSKKEAETLPAGPSDPELYFDLSGISDTIGVSQSINVPILLGSASSPVSFGYGIAFTIHYNPELVDTTSIMFNYNSSLWGIEGSDAISIQYNWKVAGQLDVAITGINHINRSGYGQLGTLKIVTIDNLSGKNYLTLPFHLSFTGAVLISKDEMLLPIRTKNSGLTISELTSVNDMVNNSIFDVFPNPTSGLVNIFMPETEGAGFTISDVTGRTIVSGTLKMGDNPILINGLNEGIYIIEVRTDNKVQHRQIILTH